MVERKAGVVSHRYIMDYNTSQSRGILILTYFYPDYISKLHRYLPKCLILATNSESVHLSIIKASAHLKGGEQLSGLTCFICCDG